MAAPKLGTKVQDKREDGTWRIVGVDEHTVSLSGPGPCRGMKSVTLAEFDEWWEEAE